MKPVIAKPETLKVTSLTNSDVFYTVSTWPSRWIDGVEFISVCKQNPDDPEHRMKTQLLNRMRKDNVKIEKV